MYQVFQHMVMVYETEPSNFGKLAALMQEVSSCCMPRGLQTLHSLHDSIASPLLLSPSSCLPARFVSLLSACLPIPSLRPQMQEYGMPPGDLIKEVAPGIELSPDGTPMIGNIAPGMPPLPVGGAAGDGVPACTIM